MKQVRTRFAPSPTGFLHIGGFRTALYAWLLARHFDGKFVLRIEDTDQERKVDGAVKFILEGFEWFGMDIDEGPTKAEIESIDGEWEYGKDLGGQFGPYIQTARKERYQEIAELLIEKGFAYRCDMTAEQLEAERAEQQKKGETPGYSGYSRDRNVSKDTVHVVRFRMPDKPDVVLQDAVKGRISWDDIPLRDPILLKSDGLPTYHLAVVVDDHDMQITHVLRGDEWLGTAPLHILLYEALGWEKPVFAHLPPVMGDDGKKLSKRHGATTWKSFQEDGYLPEALLNFIALIGWSPGDGEDQEIFSVEELCKRFTLDRVNTAPGVFDYKKLDWMNGMYIRSLEPQRFIEIGEERIKQAGYPFDADKWKTIAPLVQERAKSLNDIAPSVEFLFVDKLERDYPNMLKKGVDVEKALALIDDTIEVCQSADKFVATEIEPGIKSLPEKHGVKMGPMFAVLRVAALGKLSTPPLFESFEALGREVCLERLTQARQEVASGVLTA